MGTSAELVLAIWGAVLTWTISVISGSIWLNAKFRHLEKSFYKELDLRRATNDRKFELLATRIQRLEIKSFGFTPAVLTEPTSEG